MQRIIKHIQKITSCILFVQLAAGNLHAIPWNYAVTGSSHIIAIDSNSIFLDNTVLDSNYYIGVFYTGQSGLECGGYSQIRKHEDIIITAYGDEGQDNGFDTNEIFTFQVYDSINDCIIDSVGVFYADIPINFDAFQPAMTSSIDSVKSYKRRFYYPDSAFCNNQDVIYPVKKPVDASFSYIDGLSLDLYSGSINPSQSSPGVYNIPVFSDYCLHNNNPEIEIYGEPFFNIQDTIIRCGNDPVHLNYSSSEMIDSILWSNGDTSETTSYPIEGKAWITVHVKSCSYTDSFEIVNVQHSTKNITASSEIICPGDSVVLTMNNPSPDFIWFDSTNTLTKTIYDPGIYTARVFEACSFTDSIEIKGPDLPETEFTITDECTGTRVTVNNRKPGLSYRWNNNVPGDELFIDSSGRAWVNVTDTNHCSRTDSVFIAYQPLSLTDLSYSTHEATCTGPGKIILDTNTITGSGPYLFESINIETNEYVTFNNPVLLLPPGTYQVKIEDRNECIQTLNEHLKIDKTPENCEDIIITPDGDGFDDFYYIDCPGTAKIYGRTGKLLSELQGPAEWHGTDENGQTLPFGSYMLICNGREVINVTIIQ